MQGEANVGEIDRVPILAAKSAARMGHPAVSPREIQTGDYCSRTMPSSSHWWPQVSQVHWNLGGESSGATAIEVWLSKITSVEWHLGQRTGSSARPSSGSGFGSSSGS